MRFIRLVFPEILRFQADSGSGGSGEDPHDEDDRLARKFKIAMRYQLTQPSQTSDPYGLSTLCQSVLERIDRVGYCLFLLSQDLQPIAEGIMEQKYPSDRVNGDIVCYRLHQRGLNLDTP